MLIYVSLLHKCVTHSYTNSVCCNIIMIFICLFREIALTNINFFLISPYYIGFSLEMHIYIKRYSCCIAVEIGRIVVSTPAVGCAYPTTSKNTLYDSVHLTLYGLYSTLYWINLWNSFSYIIEWAILYWLNKNPVPLLRVSW